MPRSYPATAGVRRTHGSVISAQTASRIADRRQHVARPRSERVEERCRRRLAHQVAVVHVHHLVEREDDHHPHEGHRDRDGVLPPPRPDAQADRQVERGPHHQEVHRPEREVARVRELLRQRRRRDRLHRQRQPPVVGQRGRHPRVGPQRPGRGDPGEVAQLQRQRRAELEVARGELVRLRGYGDARHRDREDAAEPRDRPGRQKRPLRAADHDHGHRTGDEHARAAGSAER